MASDKKIVIYTGLNSSYGEVITLLQETFNDLVRIETTDRLRPTTLNKNTLAFVLPGVVGLHSPYTKKIRNKGGNEHLRNYVENGGIFLGLCAGAYYACTDIEFTEPGTRNVKQQKPGLDFFNGLAKGPIPELSVDVNDHSCSVADITYTDLSSGSLKKTGIAYGNGPAFYPYNDNDRDTKIIARYDNIPQNPAAILSRRIGNGVAFFIGVLPQVKPLDIRAQSDSTKRLRILSDSLKPFEPGRQEVWNIISTEMRKYCPHLTAQP